MDETKEAGFRVDKGSWKAIILAVPLSLTTQDSIARLLAIKLNSTFRYKSLFLSLNRVRVKIGPRQGVCLGLCAWVYETVIWTKLRNTQEARSSTKFDDQQHKQHVIRVNKRQSVTEWECTVLHNCIDRTSLYRCLLQTRSSKHTMVTSTCDIPANYASRVILRLILPLGSHYIPYINCALLG